MIYNEFISFNYCVKNKTSELQTGLCIQSWCSFRGYFQGMWSLVDPHGLLLYHGQDQTRTYHHQRNLQKTKRITSNRENNYFYVICFH